MGGGTQVKVTDPTRHAYFSEEIARIEAAFDRGEISITQCFDLVSYLRTEQRKLEKES